MLNTQLKHQVGITSSVAAFAGLAVAEKHYVRSAKLLGAVEAILEATAQVMLPSDHFEFKRNIKVLRQQLDSKIINSAWNEGRAMQLEQVLAFTLATEKNKRS